jgi:DNA-binding MarR family transcriptional regulator
MPRLGFVFYPLGNREVIELARLTKSQICVLLYLRTLDPYSNGIRVKSSTIAKALGLSKRIVNMAIVYLEANGFIKIEDSEFELRVMPLGAQAQVAQEAGQVAQDRDRDFPPGSTFPTGIEISQVGSEFPDRDRRFPDGIDVSHLTAEIHTESGFQEPKNLKEFKDLKDLSQREKIPDDLIAFVIRQMGGSIRNPRAYALRVLKDDRDYWEEEFRKATAPPPELEAEPIAAKPFTDRPRPPAIVVSSARDEILGRAAAYVAMGKSPAMAAFARKKLNELAREHQISPEELKRFLARETTDSVDITIAHPLDIPNQLENPQEYSERLKLAQWNFFGGDHHE